eukprot:Colp12_sorted_trinity150504_noHs@12908
MAARLPKSLTGLARHMSTQVAKKNDYTVARFIAGTKEVNPRPAQEILAQIPPKEVTSRVVACDGGPNQALGHPKIFINLDKPGPRACNYCGLRYVRKADHHHH